LEWLRYTTNTLYGFLGATFTPDHSGHLVVQVARSGPDGPPPAWSLNAFQHILHVGLWSDDGVKRVLEGVLHCPALPALGSGVLRLDHAVEWTPIVMEWLAGAVVRLVAADSPIGSGQDVDALLAQHGPPFLHSGRGHGYESS